MTSQPTNPTILLLKTKNNPEDKYATLFSSKNFTPQFIPVLEHHLHSDALCSVRDLFASGGLLPGPGRRYGGLIFTSQRAVEGFAGVLGRIAGLFCLFPSILELQLLAPPDSIYGDSNPEERKAANR